MESRLYQESLRWLYSAQTFGIKLGLENTQRMLAELKLPVRGQKILHVAGTNGKGSVCAIAESILRTTYVTGMFTSPHLINYRERIRVDGRMIPESAVIDGLREIRDLIRDWDSSPTFFEMSLVMALRYFSEMDAKVVILETGMGGRLDATNAIVPAVTGIASIALDHCKWLGETLAEVAGEKAGIIKNRVPVVTVPQEPEAAEVIERVAAERGAPLAIVDEPLDAEVELGLVGEHQRWNASLAMGMVQAAGLPLDKRAYVMGFRDVKWPGRFQRIKGDGWIVIDGAHNPASGLALARTWESEFPEDKPCIVLGTVARKDVRGLLMALAPIASSFVFTSVNSPRGIDPSEIVEAFEGETNGSLPVEVEPDLKVALARARKKGKRILVTGSLYLAGEALALLTGSEQLFEASAQ